MYLRAIEIQGFKSFPEKTRLSFDRDIIAIVGPNGSGKSNISDAVLWVLGEQKSRTLRGTKMEDVIFGGTEKRAPLGFAQVSLILDNSSGFLDYDSDEVVLSRRYYRNGESEYSINREPVRLKDVNSLLMDTGLGRDGYSNIGQGRIADILSDKNTDRRDIFEEAAGISRFRYRKDDAVSQLKKTEDNLLRINDKIEELELQVGPLKQQAETARKYLVLRDDLRIKEVSLWMTNLDRLHDRSASVEEEYRKVRQDLDEAKKEIEALYASSSSLRDRMKQKEQESEAQREKRNVITATVSEHESARAVLQSEIRNGEERIRQLLEDIDSQEKRAEEIRKSIQESGERISRIEEEIQVKETENRSVSNVIDGCRLKLSGREKLLQELTAESDRNRTEILNTEARISLLSEMEKEYEGFGKAVKEVMKASERGSLSGIRGPVASLLRTEDEYALAIETALGGALQDIVTLTQKDGKNALEMLKRGDKGRATVLPMDITKGSLIRLPKEPASGFVGIAYDLVSFSSEYEGIFSSLLGRILVSETLSDAIRLSNQLDHKVKVVSLDGQVVNAGGSMTGGSVSRNTGFISRKNELERLSLSLKKVREAEDALKKRLDRIREETSAVQYRLEGALEEQRTITTAITSLQSEKGAVKASITQMEAFYASLHSDQKERESTISRVRSEIEGLQARIRKEEEDIDSLNKLVSSIDEKIRELNRRREELENSETAASSEAQKLNGRIIDLERSLAKAEQKKVSSEMEEKLIIDRLWDTYSLNHTEATALRRPVDSIQKLTREISAVRNEMAALGTPNIGAIDEYARVSERYEFLSSQRDDVLKAKTDLNGVIEELTVQMKEIFLEKFEQINAAFQRVFQELFSGGKARLQLDDEEDVLECGISIHVQPPGKALSTLSLLSGGEMAFVAIALYFAILQVRPTPFCIMDEIDAALDESNVDRFSEYLVKMSDKTQFLVITHRRGTMEAADMLYGVTMQEKGVSMVIPMELDEAKNIAED